jgi:transposase
MISVWSAHDNDLNGVSQKDYLTRGTDQRAQAGQFGIRAISRLTGYCRGTVSKYLLAPTGRPVYGPGPAAVSKLEPFKAYLKKMLFDRASAS